MSIQEELLKRSDHKCELCSSLETLGAYDVLPNSGESLVHQVLICQQCLAQITDPKSMDAKHFQALSSNMWSEIPAVQVMAYRVLKMLGANSWAVDQLEQLYLEDSVKEWAEAGLDSQTSKTVDSNGTTLQQGDSVTLIKDLVVKGAGFKAKRGTMVKNISLTDDPKHIEGRVNGTHIVLVAAYLKKA